MLGHDYPLHRILQIGTSALALPLLAWMSWRYYQTYRQHFPVSLKIKRFAIGLFILSLLGGLVMFGTMHVISPRKCGSQTCIILRGEAINEFSQVRFANFNLWLHSVFIFRSRLSFRLNLDQRLNAISCLF